MLNAIFLSLLLAQNLPSEDALLKCTEITSDAARLACFDEAVAGLRIEANRRAEQQKAQAVEEFGITNPNEDEQLQEVAAAVIDVRIDRAGRAVVTLDNGQVWRQLQSGNRPVRSIDFKRMKTATIKKAALGSHRMTVEPLGRSFKVKRVDQD